MHSPHSGARSSAPRPSLFDPATHAAPGAAPLRFLDALDPERALPTASQGAPGCHRTLVLAAGAVMLAGVGALLGVSWKTFAVPGGEASRAAVPVTQLVTVVPPGPSREDAGAGVPARGPARIERVDPRPTTRSGSPALPAPVASRVLAEAPPPSNEHHPGRLRPAPQRLPRGDFSPRPAPPSAAWSALPKASAAFGGPGRQGLAQQAAPEIEHDADAELLDAVMAWDARHPPAPERATVPAAPASKPVAPAPSSP
jgi:hypothetical protein